MAGPIDLLPGRWTGWGKLTMAGGEVEKVRCIATYVRGSDDQQLRHNLRCASRNYTIDAVARLNIERGRVSGEWAERKYSASGLIVGAVVGDDITANIKGQGFKASLKVETTKCRQVLRIMPTGLGVSNIAVQLAKC